MWDKGITCGDELSNQRKVLNDAIYGFSSKTEVVFFTGVFMPLMKSKNYERSGF